MNERILNTVLLLLIIAVYKFTADIGYAEAIGYTIAVGLVCYPVVYYISKLNIFKNTLGKITNFRKYIISTALVLILLTPSLLELKKNKELTEAEEYAYGEIAGEITAGCKLYEHVRLKYCKQIKHDRESLNVCDGRFLKDLPLKLQSSLTKEMTSPKFDAAIKELQNEFDKNYQLASSNKNFRSNDFCLTFEDVTVTSIQKNIDLIRLKK